MRNPFDPVVWRNILRLGADLSIELINKQFVNSAFSNKRIELMIQKDYVGHFLEPAMLTIDAQITDEHANQTSSTEYPYKDPSPTQ